MADIAAAASNRCDLFMGASISRRRRAANIAYGAISCGTLADIGATPGRLKHPTEIVIGLRPLRDRSHRITAAQSQDLAIPVHG